MRKAGTPRCRVRSGTHSAHRVTRAARTVRVDPPSSSWRTHTPGSGLRISVPANWSPVGGQGGATYVPEGAFFQGQNGGTAFTHGVQVGVADTGGRQLQDATEALVQSFAQSNPQLRRSSNYVRTNVGGRAGIAGHVRYRRTDWRPRLRHCAR